MPFPSELDLSGTGYCASFNFRRTARALTSLYDHALKESGIRSTQFAVLTAIGKTQPASMNSIATILVMDATTLTRNVTLLKKLGLIAVSPRGPMRQRFLNLTLEGEKALVRAVPLWRNIQEKFVGRIGEDSWKRLRAELEDLSKLAASLDYSDTNPASS